MSQTPNCTLPGSLPHAYLRRTQPLQGTHHGEIAREDAHRTDTFRYHLGTYGVCLPCVQITQELDLENESGGIQTV